MRRENDFYETPARLTRALLRRVRIHKEMTIYEPCAGELQIANILRSVGFKVITNDIDPRMPTDTHFDATKNEAWDRLKYPDWVITNPPFSSAFGIIEKAFARTKVGVAVLLRLSWLEPCNERATFLMEHPPTMIFVLPRISFTGDGKSDSVTSMWAVWMHGSVGQRIRVIPKDELNQMERK